MRHEARSDSSACGTINGIEQVMSRNSVRRRDAQRGPFICSTRGGWQSRAHEKQKMYIRCDTISIFQFSDCCRSRPLLGGSLQHHVVPVPPTRHTTSCLSPNVAAFLTVFCLEYRCQTQVFRSPTVVSSGSGSSVSRPETCLSNRPGNTFRRCTRNADTDDGLINTAWDG